MYKLTGIILIMAMNNIHAMETRLTHIALPDTLMDLAANDLEQIMQSNTEVKTQETIVRASTPKYTFIASPSKKVKVAQNTLLKQILIKQAHKRSFTHQQTEFYE